MLMIFCWLLAAAGIGCLLLLAYRWGLRLQAFTTEREMLSLARQWLASELHDDAGQQLRVLQQQVHLMATESGPVELAPLQDGLRRLQQSLLDLAAGQEQAAFEGGGLPLQFTRLVQDLKLAGLNVRYSGWPAAAPLPGREVSWQLYRMVQELTQNVLSHAVGDEIALDMCYDGTCLLVRIRDYGRGRKRMVLLPGRGMGNRNLQRRAAEVGARIEKRKDGQGMEVSIFLPINTKANEDKNCIGRRSRYVA
jgi:signal transduction histidine kinase